MRKLIIILAIFVLLFVAVLIWGVARDRNPPEPGQPVADNCNGLPMKFNSEGSKVVDTDRLDEWKEACAPTGAEKSANRFSRGIKLKPGSLQLASGDQQDWAVPRAKDEESAQQVKLTLASGALVKIDASPADSDVDDQAICLCNGRFDRDQIEKCDGDWRKAEGMLSWSGSGQNAKATCSDEALRGKLFFGPGGGTLRIESLAGSAEVTSAK
jgi:hypothetical protein